MEPPPAERSSARGQRRADTRTFSMWVASQVHCTWEQHLANLAYSKAPMTTAGRGDSAGEGEWAADCVCVWGVVGWGGVVVVG